MVNEENKLQYNENLSQNYVVFGVLTTQLTEIDKRIILNMEWKLRDDIEKIKTLWKKMKTNLVLKRKDEKIIKYYIFTNLYLG